MLKIAKMISMLNHQERKHGLLLLILITMMALIDMVGVASIMPFIAVLANPQIIETNEILQLVYARLNFKSHEQFMFALGVFALVLLCASLLFKAIITYFQLHFIQMKEYSIGKKLITNYLNQPYSFFIDRHSADIGKTVLSEVKEVVDKAFTPMLTIISQGAVSLALLLLLFSVDIKLALISSVTIATAYIITLAITHDILKRIGRERITANQERFTVINDAFSGIKEVKVSGLERKYIERFTKPAYQYTKHQTTALIISQLPRFALEAVAFSGMILLLLYLMAQKNTLDESLPILALYATVGYRIMPALQQIYSAITLWRFSGPALDNLYKELINKNKHNTNEFAKKIRIHGDIALSNIEYRYPNSQENVIKNLNLIIPENSTVALVGPTGSGKTTTVDIILGLLKPTAGTLKVNETTITPQNVRYWQKSIGYVPQQIYLVDDTISANIALGEHKNEIDMHAVEHAAKIANLHDFITESLPNKYQTIVGEMGVRLSGGQRQRIGIARALYHRPKILILDEATSALDNVTERSVMTSVAKLKQDMTIILIAHRLSTVKECKLIYLLDQGKLEAKGSYSELKESCELFQNMLKTDSQL